MAQMQMHLRCSELFTATRQVAPLHFASGAKSAIVDCFLLLVVYFKYSS